MIKIHIPTESFGFIEIEVDEPRERAVEIYEEIKNQWKERQKQLEEEKDEAEFDLGSEKAETIDDIDAI